jgi:hypothetical protein
MPHTKWNSIPISPKWPWIKPSQYAKLKGLSTGSEQLTKNYTILYKIG